MFERRLPDFAADYDWLSGQQAPEEEAQAVVVSVFLFFVPSQILKMDGALCRDMICIRPKNNRSGVAPHAGKR